MCVNYLHSTPSSPCCHAVRMSLLGPPAQPDVSWDRFHNPTRNKRVQITGWMDKLFCLEVFGASVVHHLLRVLTLTISVSLLVK